MDECDAVSAQLLAVTGERDAALRRVCELTAALEVSSADGARARCARMPRTPHQPLLRTALQEPMGPCRTPLCSVAMHECAQWCPRKMYHCLMCDLVRDQLGKRTCLYAPEYYKEKPHVSMRRLNAREMEGELAECRAAAEDAEAHAAQLEALRGIEAAARRAASAEHQALPLPFQGGYLPGQCCDICDTHIL